MFRIDALGAFELRDSAGRHVPSIMYQDKRIALLLFLLIARPRGAHRRDSLLPVFWPELDTQRARNSLRQSLHMLRATLGEDVLHATTTTVGVHWSRITCDVLEFDALHESRNAEGAMALYRGDLLPGFYIANAPQFEQWLDAERARLRTAALSSALKLAAEAETDRVAIAWLSRAEILAPFQEDIVRDLMRRHVRTDNPALALAAYERLVGRLNRDMDIGVSAVTTALAQSIRHELPIAAGN